MPNKVYKTNKKLREDLQFGRIQNEDLFDSSGSNLGGRYIIESLVVADSDLHEKHGSNTRSTKNYIITLMNIVRAVTDDNEYNS